MCGGTDDETETGVVDFETADRTVAIDPIRIRSRDWVDVDLGFVETATPDGPARIRATMTNEGEDETVIRTREKPPFGPKTAATLRTRPDRTTWHVVPTAEGGLVEETPAFERGPSGHWRLAEEPRRWLPERRRLEPGEAVDGEFLLLGHLESDGRPTGTYRVRGGSKELSLAVWRTSRPGPEENSRYDPRWYPPRLPHVDGVRWYHKASTESAVFVRPSEERTTLPARVDFTLVNHSHSRIGGDRPVLYKLEDGEWYTLDWAGGILSSLPPGGERTYTVRAAPGSADDGYSYLGGGTYAFDTGHRADAGYCSRGLAIAAIVEFEGDPVELRPEEDVRVDRDGSTVTVTDSAHREADARRRISLVFERTGSARETLIAEQLMDGPYRAARNALPFFEKNVERVVLRTDRDAAGSFPTGSDESTRFTYGGRAYEVRPHD